MTAPTCDEPRRGIPFGDPAHPIGASAAGKLGAARTAEVKREQGKTVRERLREKAEADVERIYAAFEAGLESDDAREKLAAAVALLAECFGKPATTIAGDVDRPVTFLVQSAFAALEDAGRPALEAGDS